MHKYFFLLLFVFSCKSKESPILVDEKENVAFIVSAEDRKVDVIDLMDRGIIESYPINSSADRYPHHIYLSDDRRKLAVALPAYDFSKGHAGLHGVSRPGGVKIIDADTGEERTLFQVPFANHNVTFSKDGSELWTAAFSHSGKAYVYSEKGELKNEINLDPDPSEIIITKDGKYAVVVSGESTFLQVIDTQTKEVVRRIKVDLGPTNVWLGFNNTVLVSNELRKSVNFVNLDTFEVDDFIDLEFSPGFLIFNELQNELWICDGSGGKVHVYKKEDSWKRYAVLEFGGEDPHMIQFFKDDAQALLITQGSSMAYFINTATKEIESGIQVGNMPNGIAIKE